MDDFGELIDAVSGTILPNLISFRHNGCRPVSTPRFANTLANLQRCLRSLSSLDYEVSVLVNNVGGSGYEVGQTPFEQLKRWVGSRCCLAVVPAPG